jgi:uncharacterized protein (DUF1810 family)
MQSGESIHDHKPDEDPFDLERFLQAQEGGYEQALKELKRGRKVSHWMWYVFPQIDGLGSSEIAHYYSIKSSNEAFAYLQHPTLGPRIVECCDAILNIHGKSATGIFGFPDDLKLGSSMTLFSTVADPDSVFARVILKYFEGVPDTRTLELLEKTRPALNARRHCPA